MAPAPRTPEIDTWVSGVLRTVYSAEPPLTTRAASSRIEFGPSGP